MVQIATTYKDGHIVVIDSFQGKQTLTVQGTPKSLKAKPQASFTPDSKYLMCGFSGGVWMWKVSDGTLLTKWETEDDVLAKWYALLPRKRGAAEAVL